MKNPDTVAEAVDILLNKLSKKDMKKIKKMPHEDIMLLHHGLGTYIRNEFGLWQGNKALAEDCWRIEKTKDDEALDLEIFLKIPDEASSVIIEALWERLQEKDL